MADHQTLDVRVTFAAAEVTALEFSLGLVVAVLAADDDPTAALLRSARAKLQAARRSSAHTTGSP